MPTGEVFGLDGELKVLDLLSSAMISCEERGSGSNQMPFLPRNRTVCSGCECQSQCAAMAVSHQIRVCSHHLPYGSASDKSLVQHDFIEIAKKWSGNVVVLGGPSDRLTVSQMVDAIGSKARGVSETGFTKTLQAMNEAKMAIGNDSGLTHLCRAFGIPTLVVMGPTTSEDGFWPHGATAELPLYCRPCSRYGGDHCPIGDHFCMETVCGNGVAKTDGIRRMNFAVISTDFLPMPGGVATWAFDVSSALHRAGHEVTVLSRVPPNRHHPFRMLQCWGRSWNSHRAKWVGLASLRLLNVDVAIFATWGFSPLGSPNTQISGHTHPLWRTWFRIDPSQCVSEAAQNTCKIH